MENFLRRLMPGANALAILFLAALVLPAAARADDFPNDVKRTFTTDVPHFFQDDIPCAFGGKPTSGTKASCKGGSRPAAHHKAAAHKKRHKPVKHAADKQAGDKQAADTAQPDHASAGAHAGATAGVP